MIYIRWNNINVVNYAGETETQQTVSTGFRSSVAERATVNREVEGSMPSGTEKHDSPLFCGSSLPIYLVPVLIK